LHGTSKPVTIPEGSTPRSATVHPTKCTTPTEHNKWSHNKDRITVQEIQSRSPRGEDEGRSLLREAFTLTGDLQIIGTTLHVRLDPASAPRRSRALAALAAELTATETHYPGTDLTIAYSVKGHYVA